MQSRTLLSPTAPLSILFWGTEGLFSEQVLTRIASEVVVDAVMLPATVEQTVSVQHLMPNASVQSSDELLMAPQFVARTTLHVAWEQNLPVYGIQADHFDEIAQKLRSMAPDIVCVACFPRRIPDELLTIPRYGFVNLHPSLLPEYRGPAPLFWQLYAGIRTSGITLHWMNAQLDRGDMIAQETIALWDGASGPELDYVYAELGANLLIAFLHRLGEGIVPRTPQSAGGSQQSWPKPIDFTLDLTWTAQHAFNFMRGTAEWQQPYRLTSQGKCYYVTTAIAYDATAILSQPVIEQDNGTLEIQFCDGILYAVTNTIP